MNNMPSLQEACADRDKLLSSLPEEDLLRLVYSCFPREIDCLTRAYSLRAKPSEQNGTRLSPSEVIYGPQKQYDEVNRTLVGFLSLRWIHGGQYEKFVGDTTHISPPGEQQHLKLSKESFQWIRDFYFRNIVTKDDLFTLITSIIVNDLGKDPDLATRYRLHIGEDISHLNHDAILFRAAKKDLISPILRLPSIQDRNDVIRGMELGATFNFGQLAQAENAPICLSALLIMKDEERSFNLRFMEQILDIAGAAGHVDWTCAKMLTQPIFEAYKAVYEASRGVIAGKMSFREAYDSILSRRAELLNDRGFRVLDIKSPEDRALARLLCMGGVEDRETSELYASVWENGLDEPIKSSLVHTLNMDGSIDEPAVQPTYMPALLGRVAHGTTTDRTILLTSVLRYLSRILILRHNDLPPSSPSLIVFVERSVLVMLKRFVENGELFKDPRILDRIGVPDGVPIMIQSTEKNECGSAQVSSSIA